MLIQQCYNHFCIALVNKDPHPCMAQLHPYDSATEFTEIFKCHVVFVFSANRRFLQEYHFTVVDLMGVTWNYLFRSSCRQSIDVSTRAKARNRVRSAHGSPLSDTTSSPSRTPARKAQPPSCTCG